MVDPGSAVERGVDGHIGANVARYRDVSDFSQAALADRMRSRGWKWSQATVWSVEKGDRPLRLAEAVDLADILRTDVSNLTLPPMENREKELYDDIQQIYGLRQEVRVAVREMYDAWRRATTRYEWWLAEGARTEDAHPELRRWSRKLSDPQGFTREVARSVRLAEDLHRPELISRSHIDGMLQREDAFIEVIESEKEGGDGIDPEASER